MTVQFYIVATPIGNLSDISLRAVETLKNIDYIACEDTRVTRILCDKYGIGAKLFDCHKFNEKERSEKILKLLEDDNTVALVSDAGTPGISDPGSVLINELYKHNIKVSSIPGACAVSTFLSLIPRNTEEYAFIGFVPKNKKQQIDIFNKYKNTNCVFYDSPNRLMETLNNIKEEFGQDRQVAIGRELTKVFEEIKIGNVDEIIEYYMKNPLKGEIVAMIFSEDNVQTSDLELKEKIKLLKEQDYSQKDIAKIISVLYKENKNRVYKLTLED